MNWTVDLTVSYVPCPAEHVPAYWAALREIMAMHTNVDRRGRTASGKTAYRPLIQMDEDNYPPDSTYWHSCAMGAARRLSKKMGYEEYSAWLDEQGEPAHWRALYDLLHEKELSLSSELQLSMAEGVRK